MDIDLSAHPAFRTLLADVERLTKRVEFLEERLREEHEKLEHLEHEHVHDHELIERLEHPGSSSYYTGRKTIAVGL